MIKCDYLIIGSGFAGMGLKYKLLGKTILIDKNPFQYKTGESHVPTLINEDQGLFSLIPKIMEMKSYTRKLGTVFCDSYHGQHASNFATPLGTWFAWHCEREEIERLLAKELSVEIRQEVIIDIDLSKNCVVTDKNTYRFTKYLLDCSGPAMVLASKLNLVSPVDQFNGMKAQWSYWAIDGLNEDADSWANWTVINKIAADSWIWQIPLYNSSILSMGLLHRGEPLSREALLEYLHKHSAACYRLTSIAQNPDRAIKPYMKEVYSRLHYSRRSRQCCGKNWILVGDACCFADPVYSTGSGVAMLEALTIAHILNKNGGSFDHSWYEKNCNALLKTVIDGIGTWYSGAAFNKETNGQVNSTILQGGFSRHFKPSGITEHASRLQGEVLETFLPSASPVERLPDIFLKSGIRVYAFNKSSFIKTKGSLSILSGDKQIRITNKVVRKFFEKSIISQRVSFPELYLMVELNLPTLKERDYFWSVIRFFELAASKETGMDRLYYFHPEQYENLRGQLKLGSPKDYLIIEDPDSAAWFEKLKNRKLLGMELVKIAAQGASHIQRDLRAFLKKFHALDTFGRSLCLGQPQTGVI